jgi:hypothetical protein
MICALRHKVGEIGGQFHKHFTRSFLCLHFRFVLFWRKNMGAKDALKMLVKGS